MGKQAPQSPDPVKTADAQSTANVKAIQESANVNAVNQYSPTGSTTYQKDANGVPISQTVSLSPGQQQLYDTTTAAKNAAAANLPTAAYQDPGTAGGDAVTNAIYARQMGLIQPQLDAAAKQSNVTLQERGIPVGSEVYDTEQGRLNNQQQQAMTSTAQDAIAAGTQASQAQQQMAMNAYNEPYNAYAAISGTTPVAANPTAQQNPAYQVAAPDITGLTQSNYQNQLNQYNNQNSSLMNGLFGLGSAAIMMSDRRLKKDIRRVGTTKAGLPLYTFRYKSGGPVQMGVMADEVEKVIPHAVITRSDAMKLVDYGALA